MWDLPGPGLEPMSPALAGRFLTTPPPGKPPFFSFLKNESLPSVLFHNPRCNYCSEFGVFPFRPFFFLNLFILFLFLAVLGLRFCARPFFSCGKWGPTLHRGVRASQYRGLSCCRAQAPDVQAQYFWLTDPAARWHVGSSQTRARTRVPCIGRQIFNHCATREALLEDF